MKKLKSLVGWLNNTWTSAHALWFNFRMAKLTKPKIVPESEERKQMTSTESALSLIANSRNLKLPTDETTERCRKDGLRLKHRESRPQESPKNSSHAPATWTPIILHNILAPAGLWFSVIFYIVSCRFRQRRESIDRIMYCTFTPNGVCHTPNPPIAPMQRGTGSPAGPQHDSRRICIPLQVAFHQLELCGRR